MIRQQKSRRDYIFYLLGILLFIGLSIILLNAVGAVENTKSGVDHVLVNATSEYLSKGRNFVVFEDYIFVSSLSMKNPDIETVSYFDNFNDQTVGFINAFGGLGRDFLIVPGEEYEVFVKEEVKLNL